MMADDPTPTDPVDPPAADPPADPPAGPVDPPADPPADPPVSDDWRASIQDDKLRDHAGRFTSAQELTKAHLDLRKELSKAIAPLGKDPTEEQVGAYRKAIGVPKTAEEYVFQMPEGHEATDAEKAFQTAAAQLFHGLHISGPQAAGLNEWWTEVTAATKKAQADDDKAYADETMAALKREWPGEEFEKNKQFGDRAVAALFPDDILIDVRNMETKDGRFVLDNPAFVRVFAQLGREMESRGPLVPMSEGERMTVNETVTEIRKKAQDAHARGDFAEADKYSEQELQLYERRDGVQSAA